MLNQCLRILLVSANLWYFGEGLFGPPFAVFAQRVGGTLLDISWAWGLYLVVTGLLVIAIGRVATTERRMLVTPPFTRWQDLLAIMSERLAALWSGQEHARDVAARSKPQVDALLKEAPTPS